MTGSNDVARRIKAQFRLHEQAIVSWNKAYLKYIDALRLAGSHLKAADIACGRGERLKFLNDNDIQAKGAETDDDFIALCLDAGLPVKKCESDYFLITSEPEEFDIIFMSIFEKPINLRQLSNIYELALATIKPGGLFVLEVSTQWSKIEDLRLHPAWRYSDVVRVLAILPSLSGFARTKIEPIFTDVSLGATAHLQGYAIIAQKLTKDGNENVILDRIWDQPMVLEPNNSATNLAKREDGLLQEIVMLQRIVADMKNSSSWRMTAPLRALSVSMRSSKRQLRAVLRKIKYWPDTLRQAFLNLRPLSTTLMTSVAHNPRFRRVFAIGGSFLPNAFKEKIRVMFFATKDERYSNRRALKNTARGDYIFAKLNAAIADKKSH